MKTVFFLPTVMLPRLRDGAPVAVQWNAIGYAHNLLLNWCIPLEAPIVLDTSADICKRVGLRYALAVSQYGVYDKTKPSGDHFIPLRSAIFWRLAVLAELSKNSKTV